MTMTTTKTGLTTITDANNVSESHGVAVRPDGVFVALTLSRSKTFKTRRGAERWLARNWSSRYGHLA